MDLYTLERSGNTSNLGDKYLKEMRKNLWVCSIPTDILRGEDSSIEFQEYKRVLKEIALKYDLFL